MARTHLNTINRRQTSIVQVVNLCVSKLLFLRDTSLLDHVLAKPLSEFGHGVEQSRGSAACRWISAECWGGKVGC